MHFGQAKLDVTILPQPGEEQTVPTDAMVEVVLVVSSEDKENEAPRTIQVVFMRALGGVHCQSCDLKDTQEMPRYVSTY